MAPLPWLLALALLVEGRAPRHGIEVVATGGRLTVRAERVPLTQLLERIAVATGMTITYEGNRPSTLVSLDVENMAEVGAVLKLMEGLGISYVLRTDQTGEGVDLLIVTGPGAGPLMAAITPSAHVDPPPEAPIPAYNHVPLDPAVEEAAQAAMPADPRFMGLPPQVFPTVKGEVPPGGEKDPNTFDPPVFPQGTSYPTR